MYIPQTPQEARSIQQDMRRLVQLTDDFTSVKTIAGIDVGYDIRGNLSKGALVLMDLETLSPIFSVTDFMPTEFPYIPGLLSFREAPIILKLLERLDEKPDLLFIDGQGIAHPRRLGIAAHIGVLTGIPAIGVAKSLLCGNYVDPATQKGAISLLMDKNERIGTVLRSRDNVKPIYISPGHKVSHETSVALVMRCLTRYRLPEPTRLADKLSKTVNPNYNLPQE